MSAVIILLTILAVFSVGCLLERCGVYADDDEAPW